MEWYLRIRNWLEEDDGQGMVEYGLIIVLVAIVVVTALTAVGTQVSTVFNNIVTQLAT